MTDLMQLARLVAFAADDLHDRQYRYAGIVRQAAGVLTELAQRDDAPSVDGCPGCGDPIEQAATGRPRKWCSDRCRKRHARR